MRPGVQKSGIFDKVEDRVGAGLLACVPRYNKHGTIQKK